LPALYVQVYAPQRHECAETLCYMLQLYHFSPFLTMQQRYYFFHIPMKKYSPPCDEVLEKLPLKQRRYKVSYARRQ
jgi:hypothetical protein